MTGEVASKTVRLGLEEEEPVAVMVSKIGIICGCSLEYMFAPFFGAVLQTVIQKFSASFAAFILSFNGDI